MNIDYNSIFYYDETSVTCLRWKVKTSKKIIKDSVAGSFDPSNGYYRVGFAYSQHYIHRIIMILFGNIIQNVEVDHIDGDRLNNKISNLRIVSRPENARNRGLSSNNYSGMAGVYFTRKHRNNGKIDEYWCGEWFDITGEKHSKSFNVEIHGNTLAMNLAKQYRLDGIDAVNQSLLSTNTHGYSDRHLIDRLTILKEL